MEKLAPDGEVRVQCSVGQSCVGSQASSVSWEELGSIQGSFREKESPDVRTLPKDQAKPSGKSCPFVSGEQGAPVPPHSRHWPTAEVGWRGGMAIRNSEVEPTWQH